MRKGFDKRYREEKDAEVKLRMAAVRMYLTPKKDGTECTLEEVAHALGMSVPWVSKWVNRYKNGGIKELYGRPRPGAPVRIDHEAFKKLLKRWRYSQFGSRKLVRGYFELTGETISRSYARQLALMHGYSAKKGRKLRVNSASPSTVRRWQEVNLKIIAELMALGYVLVAEDEASFSLDHVGGTLYYAPRGKAAAVVKSEKRGRITVAGLISEPTDEDPVSRRIHVFGKNPNSDLFIELCKKALKKFGLVVMVVDRAGWHDSNKVKEFVEAQEGALVLIHLPTASPYLNIKERDWRQAKMDEYLNTYFENTEELHSAVVTVLRTKLARRRSVLQSLMSSPYKHNERSFVNLSTYTLE